MPPRPIRNETPANQPASFAFQPEQPLGDSPQQSSLLLRARDRVSDQSATLAGEVERFDDAELLRHLNDVLLELSEWVPRRLEVSLDITNGVSRYNVTDIAALDGLDILAVESVDWHRPDCPPGVPSDYWLARTGIGLRPMDYEETRWVEGYRTGLRDEVFPYDWSHQVLDGVHYVTLSPTPTANATLTLVVHVPHLASTTDNYYVTLPKRYEPTLLTLLVARLTEVLATDLLQRPNWRDGFTMEEFRHLDVLLLNAKKTWRTTLARLN